eukprot:31057-Pelagococcus_subviridis.AAC.6
MTRERAAVLRAGAVEPSREADDERALPDVLRAHHPHFPPVLEQLHQLLAQGVDAHARVRADEVHARGFPQPVRLGSASREARHPRARASRRQQINLVRDQEHVHGLVLHVRVQKVHRVDRKRRVEVDDVHEEQDHRAARAGALEFVPDDAAEIERRHEDLRGLVFDDAVVTQAVTPRARDEVRVLLPRRFPLLASSVLLLLLVVVAIAAVVVVVEHRIQRAQRRVLVDLDRVFAQSVVEIRGELERLVVVVGYPVERVFHRIFHRVVVVVVVVVVVRREGFHLARLREPRVERRRRRVDVVGGGVYAVEAAVVRVCRAVRLPFLLRVEQPLRDHEVPREVVVVALKADAAAGAHGRQLREDGGSLLRGRARDAAVLLCRRGPRGGGGFRRARGMPLRREVRGSRRDPPARGERRRRRRRRRAAADAMRHSSSSARRRFRERVDVATARPRGGRGGDAPQRVDAHPAQHARANGAVQMCRALHRRVSATPCEERVASPRLMTAVRRREKRISAIPAFFIGIYPPAHRQDHRSGEHSLKVTYGEIESTTQWRERSSEEQRKMTSMERRHRATPARARHDRVPR